MKALVLFIICVSEVWFIRGADSGERDAVRLFLEEPYDGSAQILSRVGGEDAIFVLEAAQGGLSPHEIAGRLGISGSFSKEGSYGGIPRGRLEKYAAEAGSPRFWSEMRRIFFETDPCDPAVYAPSEASKRIRDPRDEAFDQLRLIGGPIMIRFLASLLYFDDDRPEAYDPLSSHCYPTSSAAANILRRRVTANRGYSALSREGSLAIVTEMKVWWERHAADYGVADPQAPFRLESVASPDGAEVQAAGASGESAPNGPKSGEAGSKSGEGARKLSVWLWLAALVMGAGWLMYRRRRR